MGKATVFAALLKHWRGARGMSQLDLAAAAGVSSRHVSFLETGRSKPSREMILRLAATLDVPLREQNAILHAAGLAPHFEATDAQALPSGPIRNALERMMRQQEPYPLMVLDRTYNVLMLNGAAGLLWTLVEGEQRPPGNVCQLLFDPHGLRPYIVDWEQAARVLLSRLHRELLHRPGDEQLRLLISQLLAYPDVPSSFAEQDYSIPSEPILSVRLKKGDVELGFFTTVTVFQAPQNVALDEMLIESYFPLDDRTDAMCQAMAQKRRSDRLD